MYNIAICESDEVASESLEKTLRCYFISKKMPICVRRFSTFAELGRYSGCVDIAFLDADTNNKDCVRAGHLLLSRNPEVFLYILSDRYAYLDDAMDLKAFRYLQKNIDMCRFVASLDIIIAKNRKVAFVSNYNNISLNESEIVCVYSRDRKTYVLTENGYAYPTTISIKSWQGRLVCSEHFTQPHYSYIVNLEHISSFDGEKIVLRCNDGKIINVYPSQRKIGEFKRSFMVADSSE